ncbi:MAG TPA: response regulator, partial [Candidatus Sumerlaeota bacterium]|nr:response regulator [Candidatus Sumerlaeota bacterium]
MPSVLIVDDEENIRFTLRELLRREAAGYLVEEATNGLEAVEKVKRQRYDLIIMDVRMPKLDGMEALKQMREARPDIIVVMITAHGTQRLAADAVQAGAYDYFT